jgi:hypothetical protein
MFSSGVFSGIVRWITHTAAERSVGPPLGDQTGNSLSARPVAVDGVGEKDTDADDAEECGDRVQHGKHPKSQRIDLTARLATQSKEFRRKPIFASAMRILGNRLRQSGTILGRQHRL